MPRTPPVHREDSIPRVRRWVNQFHGSATGDCHCEGWLPFDGTRKDEADRWERPAYLNQSAWECSRSLECVWEGASTNGLGTVGGRSGALLIACATCSGTCNVAYLPWRLSPISWKSLLLVFKNEYLATANHAHGSAMMRRKLALSIANRARRQAPNAPQSCSHRLTETRENVASATGAVGLSERAKCPCAASAAAIVRRRPRSQCPL
jgi:hypothetical protein